MKFQTSCNNPLVSAEVEYSPSICFEAVADKIAYAHDEENDTVNHMLAKSSFIMLVRPSKLLSRQGRMSLTSSIFESVTSMESSSP
ncbi:MAG: hypothetical protein DDT19_03000 [Syntrophomonadaceae bacterium]|nr:hypothetical protein [Bacillota bacterium]